MPKLNLKIDTNQLRRLNHNAVYGENITYTPTYGQSSSITAGARRASDGFWDGVWDGLIEKVGGTGVDSWFGLTIKDKAEEDNAAKVKRYAELTSKIGEETDPGKVQQMSQEISDLQRYFLSPEGRQSQVITDAFYRTNFGDAAKYVFWDPVKNFKSKTNFFSKEGWGFGDNNYIPVLHTLNTIAGDILHAVGIPLLMIERLVEGTIDDVTTPFGGDHQTHANIVSSKDKNWAKSNFVHPSDTKQLGKWADDKQTYYNQLVEHNMQKANDWLLLERDGNIKGLTGIDWKIASPEELSEEFKRGQEEGIRWDPNTWKYIIPELGSTISMYGNILASQGIEKTIKYGAGLAATWAVGGILSKLVEAINGAQKAEVALAAAKGTSKEAELAAAAKAARDRVVKLQEIIASRSSAITNTALGIDVAQSMAWIRQSRIMETNAEAAEAASERAKELTGWYQYAPEKRLKIMELYKTALNRMGLDTDNMTDDKIFSAGLSCGVKTDYDDFNETSIGCRKGLMELINRNNALMVQDILEYMPYMDYSKAMTGSLLKSASKLGEGASQRALGRFKSGNRATQSAVNSVLSSLEQQTVNMVKQNAKNAALKAVNGDLGQIAKNLTYTPIWKTLQSRALKIGNVALQEGSEEGKQHIYQEEYKKGMYDNIYQNEKTLDPQLIMTNLGMDGNVLGALFGINWESGKNQPFFRYDDKLVQAVIIGALSGALFGEGQNLISNLRGGDLVNAVNQTRTNRAIASLMANEYGKANDTEHIEQFFDSFKKIGVSRDRVQAQLENLLSYVPGSKYKSLDQYGEDDPFHQWLNGTTETKDGKLISNRDLYDNDQKNGKLRDFLQKDIELMQITHNVYFDYGSLLKELGIKKGSNKHKLFTVKAVQAAMDAKTSGSHVTSSNKALEGVKSTLVDVLEMVSQEDFDWENATDEQKKFKTIADEIKKQFKYHRDMNKHRQEANDFLGYSIEEFAKQLNKSVDEVKANETLMRVYQEEKLGLVSDLLHQNSFLAFLKKNHADKIEQIDDTHIRIQNSVLKDIDLLENYYNEYLKNTETQSNRDERSQIANFIENLAHVYQMNESQRLTSSLRDKSHRNKTIRRLTGMDVDTDALDGLITTIEDLTKANKDLNKHIWEDPTTVDGLNRILGDENNAAIFSQLDDYLYDFLLSYAYFLAMQQIAAIYNPALRTRLRPNVAARRIVGENAADAGFGRFAEIAQQYEELFEKIKQKGSMNVDVKDNIKLGSLIDKAAIAYINRDLRNERRRRAIIHKLDTEDAHYTQELVDRAESGDQAAAERVNRERAQVSEGLAQQISTESRRESSVAEDDAIFGTEGTEEQNKKAEKSRKKASEALVKAKEEQGNGNGGAHIVQQEEDDRDEDGPTSEDIIVEEDDVIPEEDSFDEDNTNDESDAEDNEAEYSDDDDSYADDEEFDAGYDADDEELLTPADDEEVDVNQDESEDEVDPGEIDEYVNDIVDAMVETWSEYEIDRTAAEDEAIAYLQGVVDDDLSLKLRHDKAMVEISVQLNERRNITQSDMLSRTMFYDYENTDPMEIVTYDEDGAHDIASQLPYELQAGASLARKLETSGWLESKGVHLYYVVTRAKDLMDPRNNADDVDSYNVLVVIQDDNEKKCYVAALRRCGSFTTEDNRLVNNDLNLRLSLMRLGLRPEYANSSYHELDKLIGDQVEKIIRSLWQGVKNSGNTIPLAEYKRTLSQEQLEDINVQARKNLSRKGVEPVRISEMNRQIELLRQNRLEIINAYCTKQDGHYVVPNTLRTDVRPQSVRQSNGTIDNVVNEMTGKPIYRKIVDATASVILQMFKTGKLRIGLGLGLMSTEPFLIRGMYSDPQTGLSLGTTTTDVISHKGGLSGKLYWIFKAANGQDVPIMLTEEKLNGQRFSNSEESRVITTPNSVKLTLNAAGQLVEDRVEPSLAEIILYLVCGKSIVNNGETINTNSEAYKYLKQILVNEGEHTIETKENVPEYLKTKQFWYEQKTGMLHIMLLNSEELESIPVDDLFQDNDRAEERRRLVIAKIATFHMNTSELMLTSKMNEHFINELIRIAELEGKTEITLFGCSQLTFKVDDLVNIVNERAAGAKNFTLGAWLISQGLIKTDVAQTPLKAPYLYAHGVQNVNTPGQTTPQRTSPATPLTESVTVTTNVAETIANGIQRLRSASYDFKGELTEEYKNFVQVAMDIFSDKEFKPNSPKDVIARIQEKLDDKLFLDWYNQLTGQNLSSIPITYNEKVMARHMSEMFGQPRAGKYRGLRKNGPHTYRYFVLRIGQGPSGNIEAFAEIYSLAESLSTKNIRLLGVFSRHKGRGKLNKAAARTWLQKTLGLDPSQVIVTDGIMKSCSDPSVYGVTNVAVDELGKTFGYIMLDENEGEGLQYHEAWHYVNLLLHNQHLRTKMYQSFIESHPEYNDVLTSDVEEAMADEFMHYMNTYTRTGISGTILRAYDRMKTFINKLIGRKKEYRTVYEMIRDGVYSGVQLDKESLDEFKEKYADGAFYATIPGHTPEELEQNGITNYRDFVEATHAVVDQLLDDFNVKTQDDLVALANDSNLKENVIQSINKLEENTTKPEISKIYTIIKNNDALLKKLVYRIMGDYGIRIRAEKESKDITAAQVEETPDNQWDKDDRSVSRKDNAAARTKLFFSRIKKYAYNSMTEEYESVITDYGTSECYTSNEAWANVLDNLHACTSFAQRTETGEYDKNSIMGTVQRLAKSRQFFQSLYLELQSIVERTDENGNVIKGDLQLQNQIFATVNSSLVQYMFSTLVTKSRMKGTLVEDTDEDFNSTLQSEQLATELDQNKLFQFRMDNMVNVMNQTPRNWSASIIANGKMLLPNGAVSGKFADEISKDLNAILKSHGAIDVTQEQNIIEDAVADVKEQLVELYQKLGMDVDMEVLDEYMRLQPSVEGKKLLTVYEEVSAIRSILMTAGVRQGTLKNIRDVLVNTAKVNKLNPKTIGQLHFDLKRNSKNTRPVTQLFNNYSANKKSDSRTQMLLLAIAHSHVHPSSLEFSITGPEGKPLYPIGQNNFITDRMRDLDNGVEGVRNLLNTPYNQHSIILNSISENGPGNFKLYCCVGINDQVTKKGVDYSSMSPIEDFVQKIMMTRQGFFVLPTMADKKTWYAMKVLSRETYDEETKLVNYGNFNSPFLQAVDSDSINERIRLLILASIDNGTYQLPEGKDIDWAVNNCDNDLYLNAKRQVTKENALYNSVDNSILDKFADYFLDEINALILYYSENNVKNLVENPNSRIKNRDGSVKNGRLQFGGNGGLFRYFQDVTPIWGMNGMNLNLALQALYELQQKLEKGDVRNQLSDKNSKVPNIPVGILGKTENFDGYELIRKYLDELKKTYFEKSAFGLRTSQSLRSQLNHMLVVQISDNIKKLTGSDISTSQYRLIDINQKGFINNVALPNQIINEEMDRLDKLFPGMTPEWRKQNAITTIIANHTLNGIVSVIEFEKVFSGDPAYYSWKRPKVKDKDTGETKTESIKLTTQIELDSANVASITIDAVNVIDRSSDKIKRLGSLLSPGEEIKTDYTKDELDEYGHELGCTKYTVLNVKDVETASVYLDEVKERFKKQLIYDYFVHNEVEGFQEAFEKAREYRNKQNEELKESGQKPKRYFNNRFEWLDLIYYSTSVYNQLKKLMPASVLKEKMAMAEDAAGPFGGINVADALVFIRPQMYRRLRIGLGQWSFIDDVENGVFSDETAYNIIMSKTESRKLLIKDAESFYDGDELEQELERIKNMTDQEALYEYLSQFIQDEVELDEFHDRFMNDPSAGWLHNHTLSAAVHKFEMYALKMSYFQNDYESDTTMTIPMLNKMAIFALFPHNAQSDLGSKLYDRMNREGEEIDMITFESAVKVGLVQNKTAMTNTSNVDDSCTSISDAILKHSDKHIDYTEDTALSVEADNADRLAIRIQDVRNIRMQLNTEAHHHQDRDIGTQMFKIAFSNIINDVVYGNTNGKTKPRSGSELKKDIMILINELTRRGYTDLRNELFHFNKQSGKWEINDANIKRWALERIRTNGIGDIAEHIIQQGGAIACLPSRKIFQQAANSYANKQIVKINTLGGTAIQQSCLGFFQSFNNRTANSWTNNGYAQYNNGQELQWNSEKGSMEVLLSIKFFKDVVPEEFLGDFGTMRQWLLDNGIIGTKEVIDPETNEEQLRLKLLYDTRLVDMNISVRLQNAIKQHEINTIGDLVFAYNDFVKLRFVGKKIKSEIDDLLESLNIDPSTAKRVEIKTTKQYSHPFGIGYRIPTQGMSSMFVMRVADVMPENVGDLIVVPREFTAQTGSDFDVDKLFLATLKYENGEMPSIPFDEMLGKKYKEKEKMITNREITSAAIQNSLLLSYMDVIADKHNFLQSRGSIDTPTNIITGDILPAIRSGVSQYEKSFAQLTPIYQAIRKQEFGTGKSGIGPFALNVTNMALVLYAGLGIDFTADGEYHLQKLSSVYGKDGLMVAQWLSAMVNAHVDVAKDPYVFDLNVNSSTYNMTNFLLRTGQGKATFTFLAQPAIKLLANETARFESVYGGHLRHDEGVLAKKKDVAAELARQYILYAQLLVTQVGDDMTDLLNSLLKYYVNYYAERNKLKGDAAPQRVDDENHSVFDFELSKKYIKIMNDSSASAKDKLSAVLYQIQCLDAYSRLSKYADAMSQLVMNSRVDTEKFGNCVAEHAIYKNKLEDFIYNTQGGVNWYLEGEQRLENKWDKKDPRYLACRVYNQQRPLVKYFYDSYLMDKLNKSIDISHGMLARQVLLCTNLFDKIFEQYLISNGTVDTYKIAVLDKSTGEPGFLMKTTQGEDPKPFLGRLFSLYLKHDSVVTFADMLEQILTFNILMNTGYDTLKSLPGYDETDPTVGPIDLTLGGDINAVIEKMNDLQLGKNSIVDRLSSIKRLIIRLAKSEDQEERDSVEGLVKEGKIANLMLQNLVGVKRTAEFEVDQIRLNEALQYTSDERKNVMYSAFGELLGCANEEVRKFARDLAFYAYHSQYNMNTRDSFFELVPTEFAAQYIQTITNAITNQSSLQDACRAIGSSEFSLNQVVDDAIDTISRNFYKDADVVPLFKRFKRKDGTPGVPGIENLKARECYIPIKGTVFKEGKYNEDDEYIHYGSTYGGFITTYNSQPYVKQLINGRYVLYKRVAAVTRIKETANSIREYGNQAYLYIRVPVAGMHTNTSSVYELYANGQTLSAFHGLESRRIPMIHSFGSVYLKALQQVETMNGVEIGSKDSPATLLINIVPINIPSMYGSMVTKRDGSDFVANAEMYSRQDRSSASSNNIKSDDGGVTIKNRKGKKGADAVLYGSSDLHNANSDIIIELGTSTKHTEHEEENIRKISHNVSNDAITSETVISSMRQKLQESGVIESDTTSNAMGALLGTNGSKAAVAKKDGGTIMTIVGNSDIQNPAQKQLLAEKLIRQLVMSGLNPKLFRIDENCDLCAELAAAAEAAVDAMPMSKSGNVADIGINLTESGPSKTQYLLDRINEINSPKLSVDTETFQRVRQARRDALLGVTPEMLAAEGEATDEFTDEFVEDTGTEEGGEQAATFNPAIPTAPTTNSLFAAIAKSAVSVGEDEVVEAEPEGDIVGESDGKSHEQCAQ